MMMTVVVIMMMMMMMMMMMVVVLSVLGTHIDNLGVVGFPALDQGPGIVLPVPHLETVVRTGRDHARAVVVEVDGEHEIMVAVAEGLETGGRHAGVGDAGGEKGASQMVGRASVGDGLVTIGTRLLDQRLDEVGVLELGHMLLDRRPVDELRTAWV